MNKSTNDYDFWAQKTKSFPQKLERLLAAEKFSINQVFVESNVTLSEWRKRLKTKNKVKGLYVFWEKLASLDSYSAIYTGISRDVVKRLGQHLCGTSHNEASLPILLLKAEYPQTYGRHVRKRTKFLEEDIKMGQQQLYDKYVSFIEVEDDVELYLFEVFVSIELKCKHNKFTTH